MASLVSGRGSQAAQSHYLELHSMIAPSCAIIDESHHTEETAEVQPALSQPMVNQERVELEASVINAQMLKPEQSSRWDTFYRVCAGVSNVAHNTLKVVGCFFLAISNSTLFGAGVVYGFIKDGNKDDNGVIHNPVKDTLTKVCNFYRSKSWASIAMVGVFSFISLQVTLGVTAFAVGAGIGSKIARDLQKFREGQEPSHKPFWNLYTLV